MARKDDDAWDLATSVGTTATMVAAARAVASRRPGSVVNDPFAEPLVRAAGVDFFARLASGELNFADVGGDVDTGWMPDVFAVRSKFFDDFFSTAWEAGIRQVVIVASGLDSRSYRLPWHAETIVYEIDQPGVIEFKNETLATLGATPTAELRTVGVDLRHDWSTALRHSGFDLGKPTAWVAEGLLIGYLPGETQDRLIDDITELSLPGSRIAVDHLPSSAKSLGPRMAVITEQWKTHGSDVDIGNLTYAGIHNDIDAYLGQCGWEVTSYSLSDLFVAAGMGVPAPESVVGLTEEIEYVDAIRK
jgi:methyltransferase (TIGR00027 family)